MTQPATRAMIDLRSDTVTLPTDTMREAMHNAVLGDDSRDGDPTVVALEALAARRTGKDAAVFVPSGTMANLVAVMAHAARGGRALLDAQAHILNSEMGGISAVAGLFPVAIPGSRGEMDLDRLRAALKVKAGRSAMPAAVVCMETTHNAAGGAVLPLDYMAEVYALAREHRVPVHTDGARLFNAAVALGVSAEAIARHTDSVCFCISKGLSAPVGSLVAGSVEFVERVRAMRRMVGGNLRQAGMLAAAGIVALDDMVERLADDHARARELAVLLHAIDAALVEPATVTTNIVKVDVSASGQDAARWSDALAGLGVRVSPAGTHALRFVTHRHIGSAEVQRAAAAFASIWEHRITSP